MAVEALLEHRTTESIIGAFYHVYNRLGFGFLEQVLEVGLILHFGPVARFYRLVRSRVDHRTTGQVSIARPRAFVNQDRKAPAIVIAIPVSPSGHVRWSPHALARMRDEGARDYSQVSGMGVSGHRTHS